MSDNSPVPTESPRASELETSVTDKDVASPTDTSTSVVLKEGDCESKMDIDSSSSSIVVDKTPPSKNKAPPAKKPKLSSTEAKLLKAEREQIRKQRESLRAEREKAKLEKEKNLVEKEKNLVEKEKLKMKEKEEKLRLKEEERERKEREKKEKEDERNRLRAERDSEKEKKQQELQMKKVQQEKRKEIAAQAAAKREQEREQKNRAREEKEKEKQRLQEEKSLAISQEEKKLQKQRNVLLNFFVKKSNSQSDNNPNNSFSSQTNDTSLPQVTPQSLLTSFNAVQFEQVINQQNLPLNSLYLNELLTKTITPYIAPQKTSNDDCEIIDDIPENSSSEKFIFLHFCENVRPSYFGKRAPHIPSKLSGRNPLAKEDFLEYDVDSDEEWDEGGPGESLSGSDSDHEEKDDYEIDDKFFVPHGYLSDDENKTDEVTESNADSKQSGPLLKEQALMAERTRKFANYLTPQVIGCVWDEDKENLREKFEFLQQFKFSVLN